MRGRHLATYSGTTTYFHNSDWLGTERVRTDVNGNPYETCQSLPFGDGQVCAGGEPSPMHFTGKQRDPESNLDDFPARYYSSTQGRWLTADWSVTPEPVPYAKLGDPQSLNLYAYVDNDPSNHSDPDGHMNFCPDCAESADSSSAAGNEGSGTPGDKPQDTTQNQQPSQAVTAPFPLIPEAPAIGKAVGAILDGIGDAVGSAVLAVTYLASPGTTATEDKDTVHGPPASTSQ